MRKVGLLFPGQGSQKIGMGKAFAENYPECMAIFERADQALGFPLSELCFEGPQEQLTLTENTQPAVLATSIAVYQRIKGLDIDIVAAAGHSLGEYSAIVAGGGLDLEDALKAVQRRGQLMQQAVPVGQGAMAAVIGLTAEELTDICAQVTEGVVVCANFNSPVQIAISGETTAVEIACQKAKKAGAKRAIPLPVSAPFHSPLMETIVADFSGFLEQFSFKEPAFPIISNVDAKPATDAKKVLENLKQQVTAPVRWVDDMRTMLQMGVELCIEVGPGKVLTWLLKDIDRSFTCYPTHTLRDVEKLVGVIES